MNRYIAIVATGLAASMLTACGDDAEKKPGPSTEESEGYTLSGQVTSLEPAMVSGRSKVTIAWDNWMGSGDVIVSQGNRLLTGSVPGAFTLTLEDAPPTAALNHLNPGLLGTGYFAVYDDVDGDGVMDLDDDEALQGLSIHHAVLYVPEVTEDVLAWLRNRGLVTNLEALKPGFNLARGVCREDQSFDSLEIIPVEPVEVLGGVDLSDGCLNIH
ncbi:hypothetical protein OWM54_00335 [Myxococcus sp. MISCRS1]|jgi:hypothetical protein|uniref:hypothetical protein n=1 Tax=Myxococcus TaxID=32 RepID=UPI001CBC77EF|nr:MULTISPECIES: hypothetical protein [unclassified Myxococcus]MBZ4397213.1 hypothetical protein [Myxococcus sp. AS-1-15]MBZ4410818.1 hypothetical protein [Myxococcus sp. XM-1-1-1]MCY0995573.1 hypothetical protein [Myxococcus sp. MISCRS1]BDT34442.1 hypothetical protein MFMH1_41110 [Myxococcus sp. MH1]